MKVAASTLLLKEVKGAMREDSRFDGYSVQYVTLKPEQYERLVGDAMNAMDWGDFSSATGKIRAWVVQYPAEDYALNRYVTTAELNKIFKQSDKSLKGFVGEILNAIEI